MTIPLQSDAATAKQEKRGAALSSVIAAIGLTTMKLVVGLLTGSLGILAEAAHSALDLIAALVTFFAVRISDRPADKRHLYGYGKVENLSALVETLLLLLTCVWIIYEAIQRLFFHPVEIEANLWSFAVMGISILVDITRSRILYRAARKHNSQALEADALHFSTDIWSSSVVIIGLLLVVLSENLGPKWTFLAKADAIAALVVACIVIYISLQLGRRAISVLLDTAPPGLVSQIETATIQVPGVQSLASVRVRQAGADIFVDLTINVDRSASLEEAHQVATEVDERVSQLVQRGDVVVHVDPVRRTDESLQQTVSALAARFGLHTHYVHAHEIYGRYVVDLHVEVSPELTLGQAHDSVSRLELAIRNDLPQVRDIHSHIEPIVIPITPGSKTSPDDDERVRGQIDAAVREYSLMNGYNRLHLRSMPDGYDVVIHCLTDPDMPVSEAHHLADDLEKRLQTLIPEIRRVLVHVEPEAEK